jgi:hypothetical protein
MCEIDLSTDSVTVKTADTIEHSMQHAATASAMENLADELCETDRDWERSAEVRRSVVVYICYYSEILKERKGETR